MIMVRYLGSKIRDDKFSKGIRVKVSIFKIRLLGVGRKVRYWEWIKR